MDLTDAISEIEKKYLVDFEWDLSDIDDIFYNGKRISIDDADFKINEGDVIELKFKGEMYKYVC